MAVNGVITIPVIDSVRNRMLFPVPSFYEVISISAINRVVSIVAADSVIASATINGVVTAIAGEIVVAAVVISIGCIG